MRWFWAFWAPLAALALALVWFLPALWIPEHPAPQTELFVPEAQPACKPEPLEHARYLLAISVIPALLWVGAMCTRRAPARWQALLHTRAAAAWVLIVQLLWLAAVAGMVAYQVVEVHWYTLLWVPWRSGLLALGLGAAWLGLRRAAAAGWRLPAHPLWGRLGRVLRRGRVPALVAVACVALELLPGLYREGQPFILEFVSYHYNYVIDEFAAVMNGRTPHVDFYPQYQCLLSYLLAPVFRTVGLSLATFTGAMFALSALCLLAVAAVFRRVTGGARAALALFVPFLWLSVTPALEDPNCWHQRVSPFTYFQIGPIRYFGPWVTAAVLAWCLGRITPRRLLVLFVTAALTAINNLDFGLPALAGTLVAALCGRPEGPWPTWRGLATTLGCFLAGAGSALGGYLGFVWLRAGALPRLEDVLFFQRVFAVNGLMMLPMPTFGLHVVFYLTFMAAIAVGLWSRCGRRVLPGVLLYSGVFGCGALTYYVGRSHPQVLLAVFSAWAFSLLLLGWAAYEHLRAAAARGWSALWPLALPALLAGAGYLLCLERFEERPNLTHQLTRLSHAEMKKFDPRPVFVNVVRSHSEFGERVGVVYPLGFWIAADAGVQNVYPFAEPGSLMLRDQVKLAARRFDEAGVKRVFGRFSPELTEEIEALGFRRLAVVGTDFSYYERPDPGAALVGSPPAEE